MSTEVQTTMPMGKIGDMEISRVILGGNLLTQYHHCRDQHYVFGLLRNYNTPEKILETMAVAEENGINCMNLYTVDWAIDLVVEHRRRGGKIKWIHTPTASIETDDLTEYREEIMRLRDKGVDAFYVWGEHGDVLVRENRTHIMPKCLEIFREAGVPAGIGGHCLEAIQVAEAENMGADFYVKTFHHHDYPSCPKEPAELVDAYTEVPGYWDRDPAATAEFMATVDKPWIAFKIMAAGTIMPESAFEYAFANGADFVYAGMFDYEIAEDAKIAIDVLNNVFSAGRPRPWCG
jgi:hypothetical protein